MTGIIDVFELIMWEAFFNQMNIHCCHLNLHTLLNRKPIRLDCTRQKYYALGMEWGGIFYYSIIIKLYYLIYDYSVL